MESGHPIIVGPSDNAGPGRVLSPDPEIPECVDTASAGFEY